MVSDLSRPRWALRCLHSLYKVAAKVSLMNKHLIHTGWLVCVAAALMALPGMAQKPALVKSPRLYIFDCGMIRGLDPALFQFKKE
jgi:hypothetical protein